MALSQRLLGTDERIVVHTRTHGKALVWPSVLLVVLGAVTGAGAAIIPSPARPYGQFTVLALGAGLAIWWSVLPFLRWWTTTYTITNHRVITRRGILSRIGTDLPVTRINDVNYERSLTDRMLGCGTLIIQTAAAQADGDGTITLNDVPDVETVHRDLNELLFNRSVDSWTPREYGAPAW